MHHGSTIRDFETEIQKPQIGEYISIGINEHYEIRFIQHVFDEEQNFTHLLVTATKNK